MRAHHELPRVSSAHRLPQPAGSQGHGIGRQQVLRVSETFTSLQGEGPAAGQQAVFIRLADCNLSCGPCDTRYSWDWQAFNRETETKLLSVEALASWALAQPARLTVITGGEPMLQQQALTELAVVLQHSGRAVEIETNGTVVPRQPLTSAVRRYVVSPKLGTLGAGMPELRRLRHEVLGAYQATGKAEFKFVIGDKRDLAELNALQQSCALDPVWVMPQATSSDALLAGMRELAEPASRHGWHLSSRLHVLLWGDQRGR